MEKVDFQYQKIGNVIMIEEDDWNRVLDFLREHEVSVKVKSRPTKRAPDAPKRGAKVVKSKSKVIKGRARR